MNNRQKAKHFKKLFEMTKNSNTIKIPTEAKGIIKLNARQTVEASYLNQLSADVECPYTYVKNALVRNLSDRQSGLTTAKILRLLFNPCHKLVIDLTGFPRSPELKFERDEMIRIYKELKDQRINITRCLLTKEDKKTYLDQGGSYDSIVDYNSVLQRPEIY